MKPLYEIIINAPGEWFDQKPAVISECEIPGCTTDLHVCIEGDSEPYFFERHDQNIRMGPGVYPLT